MHFTNILWEKQFVAFQYFKNIGNKVVQLNHVSFFIIYDSYYFSGFRLFSLFHILLYSPTRNQKNTHLLFSFDLCDFLKTTSILIYIDEVS